MTKINLRADGKVLVIPAGYPGEGKIAAGEETRCPVGFAAGEYCSNCPCVAAKCGGFWTPDDYAIAFAGIYECYTVPDPTLCPLSGNSITVVQTATPCIWTGTYDAGGGRVFSAQLTRTAGTWSLLVIEGPNTTFQATWAQADCLGGWTAYNELTCPACPCPYFAWGGTATFAGY